MADREFTTSYRLYISICSIISLIFILVFTYKNFPLLSLSYSLYYEFFVLFLILGAGAKLFSFPMLRVITFSMDTAVFIASVFTLGYILGSHIVFLTMIFYSIWEVIDKDYRKKQKRPLDVIISKFFFSPSITTCIVLILGWFFNVDSLYKNLSDVFKYRAIYLIPISTYFFVIPQYSIVTFSYKLNGLSFKSILKEVYFPGFLGETATIPMGILLVLVFNPQKPLSFLVLVFSYLVFNYIFKKMSVTRINLEERVNELETLHKVGIGISSTLDPHEVVKKIAKEILKVMSEATIFILSLQQDEKNKDKLNHMFFWREEKNKQDENTEKIKKLIFQAYEFKKPQLFVRRTAPSLSKKDDSSQFDLPGGSLLCVPIVIYNEVKGIMSIYSNVRGAIKKDHIRVMGNLAQQAAIALENSRHYTLATIDGLTGVYVRWYFENRLNEEFSRSVRFNTPFSLILMDLDNLKVINDQFGHSAGDQALKIVAIQIKNSIRNIDIPARIGGDEFAIILPQIGSNDTKNVVERIIKNISAQVVLVKGKQFSPSVSVGIASFPECLGKTGMDFFSFADRALYIAKQRVKNKIEVYRE